MRQVNPQGVKSEITKDQAASAVEGGRKVTLDAPDKSMNAATAGEAFDERAGCLGVGHHAECKA
jgi:hypothetical protein